jgi:hypothetical protein
MTSNSNISGFTRCSYGTLQHVLFFYDQPYVPAGRTQQIKTSHRDVWFTRCSYGTLQHFFYFSTNHTSLRDVLNK